MHLKLLRAAAVVAVLGGTATFGLGSIQPALAATTNVGCNTPALITAMTDYTSGDTLNLAPHCTYWLTAQLPSVMHTLTINGNGASLVRTHSAAPFSVLVVGCTTGGLTLENVNITNGGGSTDEDGGAIDVTNLDASLTIYGGTFSNNSVTEYGGAIYNRGTLTVNGATFTNNGAEYGGAIDSDNYVSEATLSHDSFIGNDADEGGAIYNEDNDMVINSGNLRYNDANYGGAVYNDYDLTANNTLFSMNTASGEDAEGGAIYNEDDLALNHSLVEVNKAFGGGGGIFNDDETVDLSFSLVNQNVPDNCEPVSTIDGCVG
jgi:predicted outer membrane repeat protein